MPSLSSKSKPTWEFIGIDPGIDGGIARIYPGGIHLTRTPSTEEDLWRCFAFLQKSPSNVVAMLEEISPRPTFWYNPKTKQRQSSILKSTCLIYASYIQIRAMLTAAGIRFETATPQKWQKAMGIKQKEKNESPSQWKNRLRSHAQRLYPGEKITLYTADALLMADYLKRIYTGMLSKK